MCVFCAAIPAAMALGVSAKAKQNQDIKQAELRGENPPRILIPAGKVTTMVVSGLVMCSLVYHTHQGAP